MFRSRFRSAAIIAMMVCGAQLTTSSSFAAPPTETPGRLEARARYKEGERSYTNGDYETAYVKFTQAHAVLLVNETRWNLAKAAGKTGRYTEALRLYQELLADSSLTESDRAVLERDVALARKQVGSVTVVAPPGAPIDVDGRRVGIAPLPGELFLEPGHHTIAAVLDANQPKAERSIRLVAGVTETVRFDAPTNSESQPPVQGRLVQPPRDEVWRPVAGRPVVVGIVGGLAVVSLGTGLATVLMGAAARSEAQDSSASAEERADARSRANGMRAVSTVTAWTGLGLGAAAAVTWLVWPKKLVPRESASLRPIVGIGQLGVGGTF